METFLILEQKPAGSCLGGWGKLPRMKGLCLYKFSSNTVPTVVKLLVSRIFRGWRIVFRGGSYVAFGGHRLIWVVLAGICTVTAGRSPLLLRTLQVPRYLQRSPCSDLILLLLLTFPCCFCASTRPLIIPPARVFIHEVLQINSGLIFSLEGAGMAVWSCSKDAFKMPHWA